MAWWSIIGSFLAAAISVVTALPIAEIVIAIQAIKALLEKLGVIEPDTKEDDLGDRALQAKEEGIIPENFEKYEDYYNEIKNFELDPKKSENYSDEQKLRAAVSVLTGLAASSLGEAKTTFLTQIVPKFGEVLKPNTAELYTEKFSKNLDSVNKFFKNELPLDRAEKIEQSVVSIEKELNPDKSEREITRDIDDIRRKIQGGE